MVDFSAENLTIHMSWKMWYRMTGMNIAKDSSLDGSYLRLLNGTGDGADYISFPLTGILHDKRVVGFVIGYNNIMESKSRKEVNGISNLYSFFFGEK
jgi:hypothetical protein